MLKRTAETVETSAESAQIDVDTTAETDPYSHTYYYNVHCNTTDALMLTELMLILAQNDADTGINWG